MDVFSKRERSAIMSQVKSSGTDIALRLLECIRPLWEVEHYRRNAKNVPGKPDIVFPRSKIAVFADGDFWHGRNYEKEKRNYKKFWVDKISRNIERDIEVNKQLRREGWKVSRFWKTEILRNPDKCAQKVAKALNTRRAFDSS